MCVVFSIAPASVHLELCSAALCMGAMEDPSNRAARLRALREAAGLDTGEQQLNGAATDTADQPVLKFRNYTVRDDKITHEKTAVANPPKYEQPVVEADVDVEGEVTDACVIDQQSNNFLFGLYQLSCIQELLLSVAPKKPNWDLRRDVEPKLAKLERRTQRAMIQLMQNQQHHASEEPT